MEAISSHPLDINGIIRDSAENGPAAIALLSTEAEFDLLLVDFAMPLMNGRKLPLKQSS